MADTPNYIHPDQLRIGLYVQLDLRWWEHDFVFNSFKIRDEAQLEAVRKLGLSQLRYDPSRSDSEPLAPPEPLTDEASPGEPDATPPAPSPETQARAARAVRLGQLRTRLGEVDRTFIEASQKVKTLNASLRGHPEDALKQAGELVGGLVESVLGEDGAALHSIHGKAAENAYVHSLNVTVLSLMLGRQLGYDSEDCHTLGIGALLHDIGKLDVPSQVLLKRGQLNPSERKFLELHVEFGLRRGRQLMLDDEILGIIHDHHEYCDGSGYPAGLTESGIGRLTRVVTLTNRFDNLCNPLDPRRAITPHEALARLFGPERARYDDVALRAFIRCMGVYPPGTLVQLEDGRHGLVLGMHPSLPLRPTLILYDAAIPKTEALIVDLGEEPLLSIARSVAPAEVPPEELAYLDPRQQVSFFLEPGKGGSSS